MSNWERERLESLVEVALGASGADTAVVRVSGFRQGATRFALSEINQNVVRADLSLTAAVAFGQSVGQASTNALSDAAVVACVKRAETIARRSPPDPEHMPPVAPTPLAAVATFDAATAEASPAARAETVGRAVAVADAAGATGAGSYTTQARVVAVGNSAGHRAYNRESEAVLAFSATAGDAVGWAEGATRVAARLPLEETAGRAVRKALDGAAPRRIDPGRYDVILEPAAVAELIGSFMWVQGDAKAADEGRTFLAGKLGTAIADARVDVYSDPTHADCPARPFDEEGMPLGRVDWIKGGVLENLSYSRYWAKKQGRAFTGRPSNLIIAGGDVPLEELVAGTKRGLLVTRFWYIRTVDPMRDLYTGMTRDGTFLIEDGKIAGPVKNLRFNESAIGMLSRVEALGPERTVNGWGLSRAPFVKAREFNFTSTTEF